MNLRTEEGRERALDYATHVLLFAGVASTIALAAVAVAGAHPQTIGWCSAAAIVAVVVAMLCALLAVLNIGSDERRGDRLAEKAEAARARLDGETRR